MTIDDALEGETFEEELDSNEMADDYGDGSVHETFAREYRNLQEDGYDPL